MTTSFDNNFDPLSTNNIFESEKLKPDPTIIEIKYDHLKIITSAAMNPSAITLFDENLEQLSMKSRIEVAKF